MTNDTQLAPAMDDLLRSLGSIGEEHEFAVFGQKQPTLPGLRVEGVGEIGLPVGAEEARALIGVAQRAPYGRGEETLLDLNVRSVWQIEPGRLAFDNPGWPGILNEIVREVAATFAIRRKIRHELYKLLIYEKGSHFAAHKDSEKVDGMFATLVVYLPSRNEGGRLIVRHGGEERSFEPGGGGGAFVLRFAAFYADCEHEVEPLTDGYRIALVYNLSLSGPRSVVKAPEHSAAANATAAALARLFDEANFDRLAISLEHEYTEASLSPAALKSADRPRFDVLARVAAEAGYECFLALLTHRQYGEADYSTLSWDPWSGRRRRGWGRGWYGRDDEPSERDVSGVEIEEIYEEEWALENWVAADGKPRGIARTLIEPGEIVRDPLRVLPYEQEVHEATGNEGVSVDRWYREAVAVIWPRTRHATLLARQGPVAALPALAVMIDSSPDPASDGECLGLASKILDHWKTHEEYRRSTVDLTVGMLKCLSRLRDVALGKRFLREVMPDDLARQTASSLVSLCFSLGWTPCREPIAEMIRAQAEPQRFPDFPGLVGVVAVLCHSGEELTEPRLGVCRAALEALADVAERLESRRPDDWRNQEVLERHDVLAPVAIALRAVGWLEGFAPFVDRALANPERYDLRTILVPAVVAIHARHDAELNADPSVRRLREHVVAELSAATRAAPEKPSDWRQAVTLSHRCPDCLDLEAFANDPDAQVHRFKVAQDRRDHIQYQIDRPDHEESRPYMTCVTERKGSPHTLVCTKTFEGHERAVSRHKDDLRALEALGVGEGKV